MKKIQQPTFWYSAFPNFFSILLWPVSQIFAFVSALRRYYYCYFYRQKKFSIPIVIVGNLTVGGSGKTPFVIWLAKFLQAKGYCPGIVSRGVGGKIFKNPHLVCPEDAPERVGDEALLIAKQSQCPLVICKNRVKAAQYLLTLDKKFSPINVIISDDGLQHYALKRDLEIVIVDGARMFGNQFLLPAGPLREPISRLRTVNFIVINGEKNSLTPFENSLQNEIFHMELVPSYCRSNVEKVVSLTTFAGQKVHAVAGIGNPDRFFDMLKKFGIEVIPHPFPDHYLYTKSDLQFGDHYPILMTEKDAVKCLTFHLPFWYIPVEAHLDPALGKSVQNKLDSYGLSFSKR